MAASVFVIAGRARPGSNECENELTLCHTSMIQQMKGRFRDKFGEEWKIDGYRREQARYTQTDAEATRRKKELPKRWLEN